MLDGASRIYMNGAPEVHDGSKLEERYNGNANGKYRLTLLVLTE